MKNSKRADYKSSFDTHVIGTTFEDQVHAGDIATAGIINDHMDAVRASSIVQREVASIMPAYFKGKKSGATDFVGIGRDGKTVEVIEVKNWNRINDGMTPSEAAFDQAIGGAVSIQHNFGDRFETIIITSIARFRDDEAGTFEDTVVSRSFTNAEVASMGHTYTK